MKSLPTFEGYADSKQHRFNTAIYRYYVDIDRYREYKSVSKEVFHGVVYNMDSIAHTTDFDKSNRYRLADKKVEWKTKAGKLIGTEWVDGADYSKDQVKSYWLVNEYVPQPQ